MSETLGISQVKSLFPKRDINANKGDFGYIALVGGSLKYSGAIRLSEMANAAMRSGAGVCTLAVPKSISNEMIPHILESTIFPLSDKDGYITFKEKEFNELMHKNSVIAFGMGIGNTEETRKALIHLLNNYKGTLIVDADGINAMAKIGKNTLRNHECNLIITPHPKEFSRLSKRDLEEVLADPEGSAKGLAKFLNAVVLLKGHTTVISDGEKTYTVEKGTPGMATAGSGDVLSGIIAAIAASNRDEPLLSAAGGAYINGLAGEFASKEVGEVSHLASDTVRFIPKAINQVVTTDDSFDRAEKKIGFLFSSIDQNFENLKHNIADDIRKNKSYIYISIAIMCCVALFGIGFRLSGVLDTLPTTNEEELESREGDYITTMNFLAKDIYIDGKLVNNYELSRPFTKTDDGVYVPLTEEICSALGLDAHWEGRHPSDVYINQVEASHEGAFYDASGWNLKEVTGWAKKGVTLHINGKDGDTSYELEPKQIVSYNDGEVMYIPIAILRDCGVLGLSTYYNSYSGLYISTDPEIDAKRYESENNLSYITARAEYIQSFLTDYTVGDCLSYEYIFRHEANLRDLDEDLLISVARTESKFNRHAVSAAGALGIMQIMPNTATSAGIALEDLFDVHTSIQFGAQYIQGALATNKGDMVKALSVYNFGGAAVTAGQYDTYYANTILTRMEEMRNSFSSNGYSNKFLTEIEAK